MYTTLATTAPSASAQHYRARDRPLQLFLGTSEPSGPVDLRLLVGYLGRRYDYRGSYLEIAAADSKSFDLWGFASTEFIAVKDNNESLLSTAKDYFSNLGSREQFDLVVLDMPYIASEAVEVVSTAVRHLSPDGTVLIRGVSILSAIQAANAEAIAPGAADSSERRVWSTLLALRRCRDFDVVMGDFDWCVPTTQPNTAPLPIIFVVIKSFS